MRTRLAEFSVLIAVSIALQTGIWVCMVRAEPAGASKTWRSSHDFNGPAEKQFLLNLAAFLRIQERDGGGGVLTGTGGGGGGVGGTVIAVENWTQLEIVNSDNNIISPAVTQTGTGQQGAQINHHATGAMDVQGRSLANPTVQQTTR